MVPLLPEAQSNRPEQLWMETSKRDQRNFSSFYIGYLVFCPRNGKLTNADPKYYQKVAKGEGRESYILE